MLFSPRNELDSTQVYLLLAVTSAVHILFLTIFFLLEGYLGAPKPFVFNLTTMGSKVSMLSRPAKGTGVQKAQPVKPTSPKKPHTEKVAPKQKTPVKKHVAQKLAAKPVVNKKAPPKKEVPKKVAPKQTVTKTAPIKKKVPMTPPVAKKRSQKAAQEKKQPASQEPVVKEFSVAEAAGSLDEFTKEIQRHLAVPPGIEYVASFTLTFDLNDQGKVMNLKPRGSEPLIIYTAFKDALLKSTLPLKNRTQVKLLIK